MSEPTAPKPPPDQTQTMIVRVHKGFPRWLKGVLGILGSGVVIAVVQDVRSSSQHRETYCRETLKIVDAKLAERGGKGLNDVYPDSLVADLAGMVEKECSPVGVERTASRGGTFYANRFSDLIDPPDKEWLDGLLTALKDEKTRTLVQARVPELHNLLNSETWVALVATGKPGQDTAEAMKAMKTMRVAYQVRKVTFRDHHLALINGPQLARANEVCRDVRDNKGACWVVNANVKDLPSDDWPPPPPPPPPPPARVVLLKTIPGTPNVRVYDGPSDHLRIGWIPRGSKCGVLGLDESKSWYEVLCNTLPVRCCDKYVPCKNGLPAHAYISAADVEVPGNGSKSDRPPAPKKSSLGLPW